MPDGTLIDTWALARTYRRKEKGGDLPDSPLDFKAQEHPSHAHKCKTDRGERLYRKSQGRPAWFCYTGHILADSRDTLVVGVKTTHATGAAEVDAPLTMPERRPGKRWPTVTTDKTRGQCRLIGARKTRKRNASTSGTGSRRRLALRSSIDRCARVFSVVSTGSASGPGWHFGYNLVQVAAREAG